MNNFELYLDFDGVIVDTVECICSLYNEDFQYYRMFEEICPWEINTWDFKELKCASYEYINTYFNQPRFFKRLKFMTDARYYIEKLAKKYRITIISQGYSPNLIQKEKWINENLPFVNFIGVNWKKYKDKSHIDMRGGIFVDDSYNNLITSNADRNICFGKELSWNEKWEGERCKEWDVLYNAINKRN